MSHSLKIKLSIAQKAASSYQTDWMSEAVLQPVVLQQLSKVRYVAGGESKRIQFGQLGVRWHPGQAGFQSRESFAQNSHARPLPRVGCVSLRLPRFPLVRLGEPALLLDPPTRAFVLQLLIWIPVGIAAGAFSQCSFQRVCRPSGECLIFLAIAGCRASGHDCSTCALEAQQSLKGLEWTIKTMKYPFKCYMR